MKSWALCISKVIFVSQEFGDGVLSIGEETEAQRHVSMAHWW